MKIYVMFNIILNDHKSAGIYSILPNEWNITRLGYSIKSPIPPENFIKLNNRYFQNNK